MRIGTGAAQPCWITAMFTTAVFIQFHRTLRTRTLHGVRSKVRNENSHRSDEIWIKDRPYFREVNIGDRSSCRRNS